MNINEQNNNQKKTLDDYLRLLLSRDNWQILYSDACACLNEQQRRRFETLAPMDTIISFIVIMIARFNDQFNSIVEAAFSVAIINQPLFECRNRAKMLLRIASQRLGIKIEKN